MSNEQGEKNVDQEDDEVKIDAEDKKGKGNKELADRIHEELEDLEYYHGNLLEDDIKGLFSINGDFIIRMKLNTDGSKDILVTVNWEKEISNIKLRGMEKDKKVLYTLDSKIKKATIKDLIEKHRLGTPVSPKGANKNIMLLNPIAKQAWELRRESLDLIKKLGEGAFGEVHSGKLKLRLGKAINVAVKVIKKTTNNEIATTELQKEGALMRKFNHFNVVRTYGMVIERDTIMVVMELVTGGGLNDYVKKNRVSMDEKGSYALDIANGLAYIHSLNCIHRDIACRNCLIDISKKQAKVSDFGLTRHTDVYKIQPNERIPIRWMAPEVLKTYEYTRAADIYAYGILVWEIMADGATPYDMKSNAEIKEGIKNDDYRPIFPPDTPTDIKQTIASCWCGDASSRINMEKIKERLGRYKKVGSEMENTAGEKSPAPGQPLELKDGKKKNGGESTKRRGASKKAKSKDKLLKSTRRT